MRQGEDGFDCSAGGSIGGGMVDVGEIVARHEPVEREAALHKEINEARDEVARVAVALDDAAHGAAALQPRHLEADFGAGAGAADEDADAETAQPVDREAENLRDGRGLEREMRAAAGDLAD